MFSNLEKKEKEEKVKQSSIPQYTSKHCCIVTSERVKSKQLKALQYKRSELMWIILDHPTAKVEFAKCHRLQHLPPVVPFPQGPHHYHHRYHLLCLEIGGGAARPAAGHCTRPAARCLVSARGSYPPPGPGPDSAPSSRCSLRSLAAAAASAWWSFLKLEGATCRITALFLSHSSSIISQMSLWNPPQIVFTQQRAAPVRWWLLKTPCLQNSKH